MFFMPSETWATRPGVPLKPDLESASDADWESASKRARGTDQGLSCPARRRGIRLVKEFFYRLRNRVSTR